VGGTDTGAAVPPCEADAEAEVGGATVRVADELGAVAVGIGTLAVAEPPVVAGPVGIVPVIAVPVNGGDSKLDVGDGVSPGVEAGSWLVDAPEGGFEPPAIEVMAKAGLALPESPIKTMM